MRAILKSLHLEMFKGVKDKKYDFGPKMRIMGKNRLGKTTIADSFYWLIADKSYELVSNPNIRPDDVEECVPTVTAVFEIDGKEVTIAKMQKRKVGKPDANGIAKVTITNSYEVNCVPKTERDFKAYLEELGWNFDNILVCSHPDVFTGQKQADMRKLLFKMASEKTDYDIAALLSDTAEVKDLLASYKFEEIEAMQKASKKRAMEQVDAIPNQIVGLERAKVDIDVAEQELAKAELERQIAARDAQIKDAGHAIGELRELDMKLQGEMSVLAQQMNREISNERQLVESKILEKEREIQRLAFEKKSCREAVERNNQELSTYDSKKAEINRRYKENQEKVFDETPYLFRESEWVFDENSTTCSLCGQKLPKEKIEQLMIDFEQKKAMAKSRCEDALASARKGFLDGKERVKKDLLAEADRIKNRIAEITVQNADMLKGIGEMEILEKSAMAQKAEYEEQLATLPAEADYAQNPEYVRLKEELDKVKAQIADIDKMEHNDLVSSAEEEKRNLQAELDKVNRILAQAENNVRIDEQIAQLRRDQLNYEQAKADAEKILYQLSLVSKKKNELLVEEINQHFGLVRWILFDYQKNGEYKEVCIPEVDGKRFGESTNTGREIEAKLDICDSFQKFFDMQVPVFLDGAESINNEYLPSLAAQLILLTVTEGAELQTEEI
ncbi:MAG: AAA family ATPase [Roseburia sp.]|nr:AAA family ATPase [Roseburia sp.]